MTPDEIARAIEPFLRERTGAPSVRVEGLRRLTGGASRETWSLDAVIEGSTGGAPVPHAAASASRSTGQGPVPQGPQVVPLILQRDVRGAPKGMSRALEFRLLQTAYDAGVIAPEPMFMGDASLGGEFFFVRRIDGETLPRRLLRDDEYAPARAALPAQLGRIAAGIHALPLDGLPELSRPPEGVDPRAFEVGRHEQIFRAIAPEPHPAFELAFRWLRRNINDQTSNNKENAGRAQPEIALVHGDFRMGNVLFGPEGARAMLDWELAHAGDPMEDLAWMCVRSWRFGGALPVGGIGTREAFFAAYEDASGRPVDAERVRWWEVFGNLRWGIICLGQAQTYLSGHSNSVELASIGRRTAETEWELLELMEA